MISRISLKHSARVNIGTDSLQVSDDANAAAVVDNINLFLSLETCYWHFKMYFNKPSVHTTQKTAVAVYFSK